MSLTRLSLIALGIIIIAALFLVTCGEPEISPEISSLIEEVNEYKESATPTPAPPITPSDNITEKPNITKIEEDSEDGILRKIKYYCNGVIVLVQYMGPGGDVVREDLYDNNLLRVQIYYKDGKVVKIVPIDESGYPIEDEIIIFPGPVLRFY